MSNFFTDIPAGAARCGDCSQLFPKAGGHFCFYPITAKADKDPLFDLDFYSKEALTSLDAADIIMEELQDKTLEREAALKLVAIDALISQAEDCLEDLRSRSGLNPLG